MTSTSPAAKVGMLGVPFDAHSSYLRGTALAPPKIREALRCEASNWWSETGVDLSAPGVLTDHGDVSFAGDPPFLDTVISAAIRVVQQGRPLFLGGDHSLTYPLVRAVSALHPSLTIVHFDAHPDLYAEYGGNRHSHACPFARIMEDKLAQRLIQIGIRSLNAHQREQAERFGVEILGMKPVEMGVLKITGPVYISFDVDALDPGCAPGVSHREPGGLSVRQAIDYLHAIPGPIVGSDLVEYNPVADVAGMTATVCAKLVKELAGRLYLS
jgi:agmatinase